MSRGLEAKLDALSRLRDEDDAEKVGRELGKALASKTSHLMAARAAKVAAALGRNDLEAEMASAFDRLMVRPGEKDKGCLGKIALAKALVDLGCPTTEVYRVGVRHVQMEPVWGGQVDAAAELRAWCAQGLVESSAPDAVLALVPLLVDSELPPRLAAARSLGSSGRLEAEAVLRLKALMGDDEPEVVGECLGSLLHLEPRGSIDFVADFLGHREPAMVQVAALALGESRHPDAIPPLVATMPRTVDHDVRRTLCMALAVSRQEAAFDALLTWLVEGDDDLALQSLEALALHSHDRALRDRVAAAVEERRASGDGDALARRFARDFG